MRIHVRTHHIALSDAERAGVAGRVANVMATAEGIGGVTVWLLGEPALRLGDQTLRCCIVASLDDPPGIAYADAEGLVPERAAELAAHALVSPRRSSPVEGEPDARHPQRRRSPSTPTGNRDARAARRRVWDAWARELWEPREP